MTEAPSTEGLGHNHTELWTIAAGGFAATALLLRFIVTNGAPTWNGEQLDFPVGILILISLVLALLISRLQSTRHAQLNVLSLRPGAALIAAFVTVALLALGSRLIIGATPIAADELAPLFQARLFSEFKTVASIPTGLINQMIPASDQNMFVLVSADGRAMEVYFPGWALLMTPFVWLGVPWLLGPVMAGIGLYLIGRLATLLGNARAATIAILLTVTSASFLLNGMSLYPTTGQMTLSLLWVWLLLRGGTRDFVLAGLVGGLALSLNNPLPHAAFALPWLLWLSIDPVRRRRLVPLAAGYLPGLALIAAWILLQSSLGPAHTTAPGGFWLARVPLLLNIPTVTSVGYRFWELVRLWTWSAPGLLALAAFGWWQTRHDVRLRLLGLSFVVTLGVYCLYPSDQGFGYGARYYTNAWGGLPILAAISLAATTRDDVRRFAINAALVGSILVVPFDLAYGYALARFFDAPIRALSVPGANLCFIDYAGTKIPPDQVLANDPSMSGPLVLVSFGGAADQAVVDRSFPGARLLTLEARGSCYARP